MYASPVYKEYVSNAHTNVFMHDDSDANFLSDTVYPVPLCILYFYFFDISCTNTNIEMIVVFFDVTNFFLKG